MSTSSNNRIASMDQFRGYTVAGMFAVNFLASFAAIHAVMKHNNTYFSYADSIMPSFIFAVGFTFRLTYLKRVNSIGTLKTCWTYIKRSLALVLVSLMFFGMGASFQKWEKFFPGEEFDHQSRVSRAIQQVLPDKKEGEEGEAAKKLPIPESFKEFSSNKIYVKSFWEQWKKMFVLLLKSNMWETLAVIGVTQLFVLPWIGTPPIVRFLVLIACGMGHTYMTHCFNWGFVHGYPDNWMVKFWGTGTNTSWDGGFFGIVSWSVAMLAGTLCYDIMSNAVSSKQAMVKMLLIGIAFMVVGYGMSCLTRLYDVEYGAKPSKVPRKSSLAESPVWPQFENAKNRSWGDLFAELPFVQPDPPGMRGMPKKAEGDSDENVDKPRIWLKNYWMMGKRVVSLSFITFATGFTFALYSLFILACDIGPVRLGVFRTFGMNPLAAYLIHEVFMLTMLRMSRLFPSDSPLWFALTGFAFFMFMVYLFVRSLEKQNIYIRM